MNKKTRRNLFTFSNPSPLADRNKKKNKGLPGSKDHIDDYDTKRKDGKQGLDPRIKVTPKGKGKLPTDPDKRDEAVFGKLDSINKILDDFDKSTIPPGEPPKSGSVNRPEKPSNYTNNQINNMQNSSINDYSTKGFEPKGNLTNSSSYYSSDKGGNPNPSELSYNRRPPGGRGRGNGSNSSTALSAKSDSYRGGTGWYGLNEAIMTKIAFSTGIPSGIVLDPDPYHSQGYSQLYFNQGRLCEYYVYDWSKLGGPQESTIRDLTKPTGFMSYYKREMQRHIFDAYLNEVRKSGNRNADRFFEEENFYKYMDSVIQALQIYYCIDSIYAYDKDRTTFNAGLDNIRKRITPEVLTAFTDLRRALERQVMKPEMVNFIRFMYQNFTAWEGENTPIIRLSYNDLLADDIEYPATDPTITDHLKAENMIYFIIDQMQVDSKNVANYIREALPSYSLEGKLPPSSAKAQYDVNFLTFWHNMSVAYPQAKTDSGFEKIHINDEVNNENTVKYYGLINDDVDGLFHALTSSYVEGKNIWTPGIFTPIHKESEFRDAQQLNACSLKFFNWDTNSDAQMNGASVSQHSSSNCFIKKSWYYTGEVADSVRQVESVICRPAFAQPALGHSVIVSQQATFEGVRHLLHP